MGSERPDVEPIALDSNTTQLTQSSDIDQYRRLGEAHIKGRHQGLTARQNAGIISELSQ
jgi:hypothetical protein